MAKWNIDTIEADMAEIRECVEKLEEINRLQAQTIERMQAERRKEAMQSLMDLGQAQDAWDAQKRAETECEALREQLRQAQAEQLRKAQERIRAAEAERDMVQERERSRQETALRYASEIYGRTARSGE